MAENKTSSLHAPPRPRANNERPSADALLVFNQVVKERRNLGMQQRASSPMTSSKTEEANCVSSFCAFGD
ncbi:hypothetical protein [Rosistilla oblonga]|uniref:hypothetical protein n=1 Tax=Rosistilla oblonga TaxID=2527990 RepID=UPI003A9732CD